MHHLFRAHMSVYGRNVPENEVWDAERDERVLMEGKAYLYPLAEATAPRSWGAFSEVVTLIPDGPQPTTSW